MPLETPYFMNIASLMREIFAIFFQEIYWTTASIFIITDFNV